MVIRVKVFSEVSVFSVLKRNSEQSKIYFSLFTPLGGFIPLPP